MKKNVWIFVFVLLSVTNSFSIERISTTHTEPGLRIVAQDSVVYLFYRTDDSISMSLYNVSNPYSPVFINRFENITRLDDLLGNRYFAVKDSFIIVSNNHGELIYKLSSFDSLCLVTTIDYGPGYRIVQVSDSLLFLGRLFHGVTIYDISNIYEPEILLGGDEFGSLSLHFFNVFDEYIAQSNGFTLKIFTLVNSDSIIELHTIWHEGDWWFGDICYKDGFIYWALIAGICVVDIREPDHYEIYPGDMGGYGIRFPLSMNIYDSLIVIRNHSLNVYISLIVGDTYILTPPIDTIYCSTSLNQIDFAIESHFLYIPNKDSLYVYDLESVTKIEEQLNETQDKNIKVTQDNFGSIRIDYNYQSPCKMRLFDILGRVIYEKDINSSGEYKIGDHYLNASGIYLLSFTINNHRILKKIAILK